MTPASEAAEAALAAYRGGEISAEIALMRVVLAIGDAASVIGWLEAAGEAALLRLARAHRGRLEGVTALVAAGLATERGGIAAIRAQFDAAVALAPEAAVAMYSLGSGDILDRATAEIVAGLRQWRLLGADIDALDIGCGIGRIERALAPELRSITGTDVSPGMIAEAWTRCRGLGNVVFLCVDGGGLAAFAGRRFGLVLAVDAFPYLVAAGAGIAARHVADAAGLLVPGGALAIFNYSYCGDLDADRADIADLATAHGFAVERNGTRDFALWDGATFLLRRTE
ncbi:MAG: methyltransferase domain-containing protein [Alphaproteobacteria bacterium]